MHSMSFKTGKWLLYNFIRWCLFFLAVMTQFWLKEMKVAGEFGWLLAFIDSHALLSSEGGKSHFICRKIVYLHVCHQCTPATNILVTKKLNSTILFIVWKQRHQLEGLVDRIQ